MAWRADHDIELVSTPSNASWLNWIESELTALHYFTLDGSHYPPHTVHETAIARYVRWSNRRATPKRRFAVNSKIRQPDYLTLRDAALGKAAEGNTAAPRLTPVSANG